MRLQIRHRTEYRYSQAQRRVIQLLRMTPASDAGQDIIDWRIDIDCDARLKTGRDGFGNETAMLYVTGPVDHVAITVTGEVVTQDRSGVLGGALEPLPPEVFLQYTHLTRTSPAVRALAGDAAQVGSTQHDHAFALATAIRDRVAFDVANHLVVRDADTTLTDGHGACQDMAHLFIAGAHALGLPARYVSGHIFRGDDAVGGDASHAWAEAYFDGFGWVGFDPANGKCPDDAYVRVAIGRDHRDAAPVAGTRVGGGTEALTVNVDVAAAKRRTPSQSQS